MADQDQRRLIYFPIVHTATDLGAMADSVNRAAINRLGRTGVRKKNNLVHSIWREIEDYFSRTPLPYPRVNLYQDGLPVCGMEVNIVNDLAASGSRNHRLLLRLIEKGARLMGTESPELLIQEHAMVDRLLAETTASRRPKPSADALAAGQALLMKRDQFIADRINTTLGPGDVGILFLGLLHDIGPYLAGDIEIRHPLGQLRTETKAG